jgi:hypothetical protein
MPLSREAQALADTFTAGLTADQRTNFNNAVRNSPALENQINAAVASGDLRGFSLLPAGTNAGGQFNPTSRTLELPASIMTTPSGRGARFDAGELTFVMGHEIQHSINRPTLATAYSTFDTEVNRIGRSAQPTHDYTAPLNALLNANRNDEATANIAGYNATVGMLRSTNGGRNPTLEEIYRANPGRMQDVITASSGRPTTYALRDGYTLNADMSMTPGTANARGVSNTQAMGQYYYDKPASQARLGANGDSNYQNYYAANPLSTIARVELANAPAHAANGLRPQLCLNMTTLGIDEAQLERNGLDLGGSGLRQPYVNTGTNPPTQGHFDHTATSHRHVPITMPEPHAHSLSHGQSRHPAVQQAMDALDRSPNIPADAFGANRLNAATGIALHAASQNLRPDHIVFNERQDALIAVQGPLSAPTSSLSTPLPAAQAIATDVGAGQRQLESLQPTPGGALVAGALGAAQTGRELAPQDSLAQDAAKPR